jgi:hypothetical protein
MMMINDPTIQVTDQALRVLLVCWLDHVFYTHCCDCLSSKAAPRKVLVYTLLPSHLLSEAFLVNPQKEFDASTR